MTVRLGPAPLTREVLGVPVTEGPVPEPWDAAIVEEPTLWADADRMLFRSGEAAVFVTADSLTLDAPGAELRATYDWLAYATGARALLTLRRRFNLHATLVVSPAGEAVAILGDSTAGKSTTTIALVRRGWRLAADDIVEVVPGPDGLTAHPVDRPIHLSDDAARLLDADLADGRPLRVVDKRVYRLGADLAPRPLRALAVLTTHAGPGGVSVERIDPLAAVPTVAAAADRYRIGRLPEHREAFLRWTTEVCRHSTLTHVSRPQGQDTVDQVADAVAGVVS